MTAARSAPVPAVELIEWLAASNDDTAGRVVLDADTAPPIEPPEEAMRCHPDLVVRITELGRFARARRVFVAGCPVLVDPERHHPFAAAWGTHELVLRLGADPGAIARAPVHEPGLPDEWVRVDPYPQDVTFRRGTDLLRDAVQRAATR